MTKATYSLYAFYRAQILVMFGLFGVASVVLLASVVVGAKGGPPTLFALAWVAIACWNGYWFGFRIAYRLELDGDVLSWNTPLRSGAVDLADLTQVRPWMLTGAVHVLRTRSGASVLVWSRKGLAGFTQELQTVAPHVDVRLSLDPPMKLV